MQCSRDAHARRNRIGWVAKRFVSLTSARSWSSDRSCSSRRVGNTRGCILIHRAPQILSAADFAAGADSAETNKAAPPIHSRAKSMSSTVNRRTPQRVLTTGQPAGRRLQPAWRAAGVALPPPGPIRPETKVTAAFPIRDEERYIPGICMISMISTQAPGICRCGWSLPKIFVAASAESACTTE
jgi:hypothetical protein